MVDVSDCPLIEARSCGVDPHKEQIAWHRICQLSDCMVLRTNRISDTGRIPEKFVPRLEAELDSDDKVNV